MGKRGNVSCTIMPMVPCEELQLSLPVGLLAHWTLCLANIPLKTPLAGEPSHIPLREVDGWTCFKVKIGQPLVRLSAQSSRWRVNLLRPSMKPGAFQLFHFKSERRFSIPLLYRSELRPDYLFCFCFLVFILPILL